MRVAVPGFSDTIKNSGYLDPCTLPSLDHRPFAFLLVNKFHDNDDSDRGEGHTFPISIFLGGPGWIEVRT